jgi:hypothetical protein
LRLVRERPWTSDEPLPAIGGPAAIDWADGRVRVGHAAFVAELDPAGLSGSLFRVPGLASGIEVALRTALCSRLALTGGLPLHAAGIVVGGRGVVCFGPSGAGKSTLAALSPHAVLSDELVAVVPGQPYSLTASGFWGTLDGGSAHTGSWPLAALLELGKGPGTRFSPLGKREALVRLVGVLMVPPGPPLWAAALQTLGHLVREVPVERLSWSPSETPWREIEARLRDWPAV